MSNMIGFLLAALVISVNAESPNSPTQRVVGGKEVSRIQDTPYHVSVQIDNKHVCGGVIIHKYYILTAASCVYKDSYLRYSIRAGTLTHNYGGSLHSVNDMLLHENFKIVDGIPENDIAILELYSALRLDSTRNIILPTLQVTKPNTIGKILGWGKKDNSNSFSDRLKEASVFVLDTNKCRYEEFDGILPSGQICAKEAGTSACMGDAGSPLVINGKVAGIISWGKRDCKKGHANAYTDIFQYQSWIASKLRNSRE